MSLSQYPLSLSPHIKLQRASATIDEITKVLSEFSRSTTPEPLHIPTCSCCDVGNCDTKHAWEHDRAVLADKLVLSAEIGQALLERHEAYVADQTSLHAAAQERISSLECSNDQAVSRMADLVRSKDNAEKSEAQAHVTLDVAEASNRALLREIQEERTSNSRLLAQLARSVGWEEKLNALTLERDDLTQERDAEFAKSRALESKLATLTVKCSSLQADINRLVDQLEAQGRCSPQRELSEEILREARARLDMMQRSLQPQADNSELTHLLEALVADGEALKRDNAELRNFLGEARTEIRTLSDEVLELRAGTTPLDLPPVDIVLKSSFPPPPSHIHLHNRRISLNTAQITHNANYRRGEGWASTLVAAHSLPNSPPPYQLGFSGNNTPRVVLTSLDDPETRNLINQRESSPSAMLSSNNIELQPGAGNDADDTLSSPVHSKRRTLLLLSQSRGVQTESSEQDDYFPNVMPPFSPVQGKGGYSDAPSTTDQASETSSISGMTSANAPLSDLIGRLTVLLARLNQTTVESLTARLKRQNLLAGSDISYLSRSTIANIQNDVAQLRTHFRNTLEVERQLEMTRKDLRNLLRLAKDIFSEMGRLKAVVNDVTLDPANAARVLAADDGIIPSFAAAHPNDVTNKDRGAGWIAPITKLFAASGGASADSVDAGGSGSDALRESNALSSTLSSARAPAKRRPPARPVPKLAAAVASSATTVNVEFSSSRARRAVTTTAVASSDNEATAGTSSSDVTTAVPGHGREPRRDDLLCIFAGAPPKSAGDSWVLLPKGMSKKLRSTASNADFGGPPASTNRRHKLSRNVDAIVDNIGLRHDIIGEEGESALTGDAEEGEGQGNNLQETVLERTRTLRPRGLSDSSIHSTFRAAGGENGSGLPVNRLVTPATLAFTSTDTSTTAMGPETSFGGFDRQNVLKNLSKTMQEFARYYVPGTAVNANAVSLPNSQRQTGGIATNGRSVVAPERLTSLQTVPPASLPRPVQPPDTPSTSSPIRSHAGRGRRNAGTGGSSPSSSSPGRMPALSNLLAAVVDIDRPDSEQGHARHPRRTQDAYDRNWGRRDKF